MWRTWPGRKVVTVLWASLTADPETPDISETSCSISVQQSAATFGRAPGASRISSSVTAMAVLTSYHQGGVRICPSHH